MNERKKLKKQLVNKYIFKMYLSVNEVKKILSENPKDKHDTLFASLTVGCVKINAVVFPTPDKMLLGFDILNREVKAYGLSYTECNFEVINGKVIK